MNTIKSFVKQFIAVAKGDSAAAQAQKAYRQANSKLTSQIAQLEGKTPDFEDAIELAQENLATARVNGGQPINDYYISTLLECKNKVTQAEDALETHKAKITFLTQEKELLNQDVEADIES